MPNTIRQWKLVARPKGLIAPSDLQLSESAFPSLQDGQALERSVPPQEDKTHPPRAQLALDREASDRARSAHSHGETRTPAKERPLSLAHGVRRRRTLSRLDDVAELDRTEHHAISVLEHRSRHLGAV